MAEPKPKLQKTFNLEGSIPKNGFRKSIVFNWYAVEPTPEGDGCLIHVAYVDKSAMPDVHTFLIPSDGIENVKNASMNYIAQFKAHSAESPGSLKGNFGPPELVNFLRLSRTGKWAEIWFVLIPMCELATAAASDKKNFTVPILGAAIAHSTIEMQERLLLALLSYLPPTEENHGA